MLKMLPLLELPALPELPLLELPLPELLPLQGPMLLTFLIVTYKGTKKLQCFSMAGLSSLLCLQVRLTPLISGAPLKGWLLAFPLT